MIRRPSLAVVGLFALAAAPLLYQAAAEARQAAPPAAAASTAEYFETKVRPVLAANCYDCHTDEKMGGLRLDSREGLLKGGRSGAAIVPGDPDKSLLIVAVQQTRANLKMPKGGQLKPAEVDALAEWVRAGAPWFSAATTAATTAAAATTASTTAAAGGGKPAASTANAATDAKPAAAPAYVIKPEQRAFWSFQPIHVAPVPAVSHTSWPNTDIDRYVLASLERAGLAPVRAADKRTLLRRATLDLIGLPPTPDEIDAFEKDDSPDAFAKVVDRLLASPHYGETWGRLWLDVARYGEDDYRSLDPERRGYNPYPNAYLYRDWVIKAFNDDLPYGQFVRAQLAGDLLGDPATRARTLPALGFLGLGPWFYDNGAVEVTRADERHDRVDVVSRGFLGLTVGCARCHDHKYDPIPTKDYYSLAGVFLDTSYREYPLVPKTIVDEYNAHDKQIEKREKLLEDFLDTESRQLRETLALQSSKYMTAAWRVLGEPKDDVAEGRRRREARLRAVRSLAEVPGQAAAVLSVPEGLAGDDQGAAAARPRRRSWPTSSRRPILDVMFDRKEIKEENDVIAAKALIGTKKKEPAKLPSDFVTNDDFCPGCGLELKSLPIERNNLWTDVFQRDLAQGFDPAQSPEANKPGLLAFRGWGLERQLSADRRRYIDGLRTDIAALRKAQPPKYAFVHGVADVETPINLKVSKRGSPYNLGDEEPRHFLSVLSPGEPAPFTKGSGRLELADDILSQPISMRVIVNRVWKGHFGTGMVDTPSNFGIAGERPSNPELLEYLAQRFVDQRLSIKQLHRDIMLSAVYQLSTDFVAANFEKDAGNRLYWRADRHRMTAEQIRDSLLLGVRRARRQDGRAVDAAVAVVQPPHRLRQGQPLQARRLPAVVRFPEPEPVRRAPLHDHRPAAAAVLHEQRFHAAAGRVDRAAGSRRAGQHRAHSEGVSIDLRTRAERPEIKAGLTFLTTEPMKAYEEEKNTKDTKGSKDTKDAKDTKGTKDTKEQRARRKREPGRR